MGLFSKLFGTRSEREVKRIMPTVDKILSLEAEYKNLTEEELKAKTPWFKERLANGETLDDILPEAFAAAREAADRVLGQRAYPVQLIGTWSPSTIIWPSTSPSGWARSIATWV